jgi:hypothetical protein
LSTILDVLRASGGTDVEILTVQLICPAWAQSLYLCNGFFDQTFTLETGQVQVFTAVGLDLSRPRRGNDASESLGVAIDNVRNEGEPLIAQAKAAGAQITMTMRSFLESVPTAPAERPISFKVLRAAFEDATLSITAGNPDLVNTAWPRDRYTAEFAPGITYIA